MNNENDSHEEYQKWEKKQNSVGTKISRNIKPIYIILFFGFLIFGNSLVSNGTITRTTFFLFLIMSGIVIAVLLFKTSPEPKEIPEHIAKQKVYELFERKRKEGIEFPSDCRIKVNLLFGSSYETDVLTGTSGIIKKEVGVEIYKKGYRKYYVVSLHPYTGVIRDIIPKPLGISSKDALGKDKQIIPVQMLGEK